MYWLLADLVLGVHVAFASFVVLGLIVIWVGGLLRFAWVRSRWFRGVHLAAMGVVVTESLWGMTCPLTRWESRLRNMAGQSADYEQSFMHHWAQQLFYYDLPPWVFMSIYLCFFVALLVTLWLVPVNWRGRGNSCRRWNW